MNATPSIQVRQVFSGHESFPIRFRWLTKAVRVCESAEQRDFFSRPDAMVELGVGKNMVNSMRSWAMATEVLEADGEGGRVKKLKPTQMGAFLFGKNGVDPFMEDPATIWLIHWSLTSTPKLATWYWSFNELRETEFERDQLVRNLIRFSRETSDREMAQDTIERDVDCFLRTYVPSDHDKRLTREELLDCPLTELGLIRRSGGRNTFAFLRHQHETLPNDVFLYCLLIFWERHRASSPSLRFDEVAYASGSPGQIFKLTENALVDRLHQVGRLTSNKVRYDDTSGLRQIFRQGSLDPLEFLRTHYGVTKRELRHANAR